MLGTGYAHAPEIVAETGGKHLRGIPPRRYIPANQKQRPPKTDPPLVAEWGKDLPAPEGAKESWLKWSLSIR